MPKQIYKYEVRDREKILMSAGGQVLSTGLQKDREGFERPYVWAAVDIRQPLEKRDIVAYWTGDAIPEPFVFIGTLQRKDGIVLHIVEHPKGGVTSDKKQ